MESMQALNVTLLISHDVLILTRWSPSHAHFQERNVSTYKKNKTWNFNLVTA